jgi:4-hydroxy-3-polyprenylbenzoate decarboxylase
MQVFDERTCAMHWQIHKHGAEHMRQHLRAQGGAAATEYISRAHGLPAVQQPLNQPVAEVLETPAKATTGRLEVAAVIGTDPAVTFSAVVPAPPAIDELMIAGFLRQKPVELVKCETIDLEVPATAEIVIEGYVDPDERRIEGPFGDHTGFYSLADYYPLFHVTCITHRKHPIYATTIVGKPPMEDGWMGHAIGRILLPAMQMQFPEIVDIHMPVEGVFHNLMIVAIKKSYPGHARKVMNGIWGLGQAMFTKCIVVVDDHVPVDNIPEVVLNVFNHIDPERDIQFTLGPVDALDHASRLPNFGSKMGIDATRKWPSEGFERPWPKEILMDSATKQRVDAMWEKLGL